jgi:hypothetical protein
MRSSFFRNTLLAAALVVSGVASAQDAGRDEITLKDGATIRGTIVSSEPGVSVRILEVGQKEPRAIPWARVTDVERDKYAPKPSTVQPGSAGPGYARPVPLSPARVEPPEPVLGDPGVVRLHVDSPVPVQVSRRSVADETVDAYGYTLTRIATVCMSPCDKVVDGNRGQFIATGDFPGSKSFSLSGMKGDVDLKVKPGSSGLRALGVTSLVLGSTALVVGGTLALLGGFSTTNTDAAGNTTYGLPVETKVGLVFLGAGGVAIVGGIVAMVGGGSSFNLRAKETQTAKAPRYWLGEF